jgi:threonine synthase
MFGSKRTKELLESLNTNGYFEQTKEELAKLQEIFSATYSDDAFGLKTIKTFLDDGYLMDPHTATCIKAYEELREDKTIKTVIYSTAEWTKFSSTVLNALNEDTLQYKDIDALESISKDYGATIPKSIQDIFDAKINHDIVIDKENIEGEIVKFIQS